LMVRNNNLTIRLVAVILILCIGIMLVQSTLFTTNIVSAESNSFKDTNVLDDLRSATINGEPFDIKSFPFTEQGNIKIVQVIEYCYSFRKNKQSNYGLYF